MDGIFPSRGEGKSGLKAGLNPNAKQTLDETGTGNS